MGNKNHLARILIGVVFLINVQCAVLFLIDPSSYSPNYGLQGLIGDAVVQGFAVLFLMWNVPYAFAIWNPVKHFLSVIEANIMQLIGLIGETFIFLQLPKGDSLVQQSIMRFIVFDAIGLCLLFLAGWLVVKMRKPENLTDNGHNHF